MTTPLKRLLKSSMDVLAYVPCCAKRADFIAAIQCAQAEGYSQTGENVRAVVTQSRNLGWGVEVYDALLALAVVREFPGRKIRQVQAFRARTDDGVGSSRWRDEDGSINRLKRAKEIIEVAQGVLD